MPILFWVSFREFLFPVPREVLFLCDMKMGLDELLLVYVKLLLLYSISTSELRESLFVNLPSWPSLIKISCEELWELRFEDGCSTTECILSHDHLGVHDKSKSVGENSVLDGWEARSGWSTLYQTLAISDSSHNCLNWQTKMMRTSNPFLCGWLWNCQRDAAQWFAVSLSMWNRRYFEHQGGANHCWWRWPCIYSSRADQLLITMSLAQ